MDGGGGGWVELDAREKLEQSEVNPPPAPSHPSRLCDKTPDCTTNIDKK